MNEETKDKFLKLTPVIIIVFLAFLGIAFLIHQNRISQLEVKSCTIKHSKNQYGITIANVTAEIYNPLDTTIGGFKLEVRTFEEENPDREINKGSYQFKKDIGPQQTETFSFSFSLSEDVYDYECYIKAF